MPRLEAYYDAVIRQHGYSEMDFDFGDSDSSPLHRRFVAVDDREAVKSALDRPTLVTTGVGITGPPHLGTVGQILTAIRFQEIGLDVQLVIADLESYHNGMELEAARRRAERFRRFIVDLGFDEDRGWLRTQEEAHGVMHTAHLLARYYTPAEGGYWPDTDPTAWEEAVEEMYDAAASKGTNGPTFEAATHHSAMLHATDFLHPVLKQEYEQVVIALGIDEHALTLGTRRFKADAGIEGRVAGLHARMITGVDEHPKMARSAPGSAISLEHEPEVIERRLLDPVNDDPHPPDSLVFQAMCLASEYSERELDRLERLCAEDGDAWDAAKEEYAAFVVDLARQWKRTASESYD